MDIFSVPCISPASADISQSGPLGNDDDDKPWQSPALTECPLHDRLCTPLNSTSINLPLMRNLGRAATRLSQGYQVWCRFYPAFPDDHTLCCLNLGPWVTCRSCHFAVLLSPGVSPVSGMGDKETQDWTDWQFGNESESKVTQSSPTLCDPVDCSPPGSSVHGILQARMLEWGAISFSKGSSWHRDQTHISYVSCIIRQVFLPLAPPGKPLFILSAVKYSTREKWLSPGKRANF